MLRENCGCWIDYNPGHRDKIERCSLHEEAQEATIKLEKFRAALNKIATMHAVYYERNGPGMYGIGVVDGHRCAASVAKEALNGK